MLYHTQIHIINAWYKQEKKNIYNEMKLIRITDRRYLLQLYDKATDDADDEVHLLVAVAE